MILRIVRIPLTLVFAYTLYRATIRNTELSPGDIVMVLAYGLFGAVIVAVLWAPVIGERIADPMTGTLTRETSLPPEPNMLVRWISRLQRRGFHRLALVLIFMEGIRHPLLPQPALLGLRSARPGSFLERCFAKEVYRFNNIQNCLHAYRILTDRHHLTPPPHQHPEVNLAIMSLTRVRPPEPTKLQVKSASSSGLPDRNPRIRLFDP